MRRAFSSQRSSTAGRVNANVQQQGAAPIAARSLLLGLVPGGTAIRRSGARAGELVFVSGAVGDAAAGLVPVERAGEAERAAVAAGCPIHRIGVIEATTGVRYLEHGRPVSVDASGHDHFLK